MEIVKVQKFRTGNRKAKDGWWVRLGSEHINGLILGSV